MTELSNNNILKKSFGAFFIASVMISVIAQVNNIVDGLILGHLISPDALSINTLASPILSIVGLLNVLITSGSAILVTKEIGNLNYSNASRIFTLCLYGLATLYGVVCLGVSIFSDNLAEFLTTDERLLPMLKDYLHIYFLTQPFTLLVLAANMFVEMAGKPKLVTISTLVSCISNILLDLLLIGPLGMGIKGAVLATCISFIISFFVCVPFLHSKECVYHFIVPKRKWTYPLFGQVCSTGAPNVIGSITFALFYFFFNNLVQKHFGADGMFVMSVILQIFALTSLVMEGAKKSINGVGGILLGEKDIDGYRTLTGWIFKYSSLALALFCLLLFFFPQIPLKAFGATDTMLPDITPQFRQLCLFILPMSITNLLNRNFMVLGGYRKLVTLSSVLSVAITLPAAFVTAELCPAYFWVSIPLSLFLALVIIAAITTKIAHKDNSVHPLTLIPIYPNDPFAAVSLSRSAEGLKTDLVKIVKFLEIMELPEKTFGDIMHCIEELSLNIISHSGESRKDSTFDIRVVDEQSKVSVSIKDDGMPFNPIFHFDSSALDMVDEEHLEMVILNYYCKDIKYSYRNGINCVNMSFPVPGRAL